MACTRKNQAITGMESQNALGDVFSVQEAVMNMLILKKL